MGKKHEETAAKRVQAQWLNMQFYTHVFFGKGTWLCKAMLSDCRLHFLNNAAHVHYL